MELKAPAFGNVLIVRTDRIGDVLLALPMVPALRTAMPHARISMLLRSYTSGLVEGFAGLDEIITVDRKGEGKGFFQLIGEIRGRQFDLAILSHPTFRLVLLVLLAGIPARVGSGYRWYSFLLNHKVFEHRKTAERHEAEYNLSLLRVLGIDAPAIPAIELSIPDAARMAARAELARLGIADDSKIVIVHPGSGGSARDWSPGRFGALAAVLSREGLVVIVTGSSTERMLVERVVNDSGGIAKASWGRLSLKELAALIRMARLFVSNSTGPLHIAAAVGTPVIGFYPPIRECSPRRWGPLARNKAIFTADKALCSRCRGGECQGNDCMDQITVEQVLEAARKLLDPQKT